MKEEKKEIKDLLESGNGNLYIEGENVTKDEYEQEKINNMIREIYNKVVIDN